MPLRPCLGLPGEPCGAPCSGPRCPAHARPTGYTHQYRRARAVLLEGNPRCWICGQPGADTADHVVPVSEGGTSDLTNLRPAHLRCNSARGNRAH